VPSALSGVVADALRTLRERRPRAEVLVQEGWSTDLGRLVLSGELDLAVVSADAGIDGDALLVEPFVVLLHSRHPLANSPTRTLTLIRARHASRLPLSAELEADLRVACRPDSPG
jgi:hypothetical protein